MRNLLLVSAFVLAGCGASKADIAETTGEDSSLPQAFAKGHEARAWLADANHIMFETGKQAALDLIGKLYAAGAVDIRVTDSSKLADDSPVEVAATLVYKFPADPAKRASLVKTHNDELALEGEETETDTGQEYGEVVLD